MKVTLVVWEREKEIKFLSLFFLVPYPALPYKAAISYQLSAVSQSKPGNHMQDFHKLGVWQKAHSVAKSAYLITRLFPDSEKFGMTSQMRRAAVSIPTNISEGCGRNSDADFARFLTIAFSSACELEYLSQLSEEVGLADGQPIKPFRDFQECIIEVKKMLSSLMLKLRAES